MLILILANGSYGDYEIIKTYTKEYDLVICADGGLNHVVKLGLNPDIILGDFDSVSHDILAKYSNGTAQIIKYAADKDYTDTQLAVDFAIDKGADEIYILGGVGTRFDHSYANVMLLYYMLKKGVKGKIINDKNIIGICNDYTEFIDMKGSTLSLLPFMGGAVIEKSEGLKYPTDNLTLQIDYPIGISNRVKSNYADIKLKHGVIIWIAARD